MPWDTKLSSSLQSCHISDSNEIDICQDQTSKQSLVFEVEINVAHLAGVVVHGLPGRLRRSHPLVSPQVPAHHLHLHHQHHFCHHHQQLDLDDQKHNYGHGCLTNLFSATMSSDSLPRCRCWSPIEERLPLGACWASAP